MIRILDGERPAFVLDTANTTYAFMITPSGHPEHIYYGRKIELESVEELEALRQKREFEPGNAIVYSEEHPALALEDTCLEFSALGHGDLREPFLEIARSDGSRTTDLLYKSHALSDSAPPEGDLPASHTCGEFLSVDYEEEGLTLELRYRVFPDCDVITRSAVLTNTGDTIELERLLSMQLDLPSSGYSISSFHGAWAREMQRVTTPLFAGRFVVESRAGCSSNRANPFIMLHEPNATETAGEVYGFNLIYSGNHYESAEVNAYGKTRVVTGINPTGFRFRLENGERFEAPEAVMTYSPLGFTGQSVNMHRFVREHIIRPEWKDKERPILLNSWEAFYFNITERSLVSLAKAGRDLGIELFVMDDGWFGERNNDSCSLGDWDVNPKKLPGGLPRLGSKITALGLQFGIWVEPEMVNVKSRLYEQHPDWAMAIPGRLHSEGRHQRILDFANPAVTDYITEKMTEVFSSADISYVKWDMNRVFSDVFSPYLPAERQGEVAHRYMIGLYKVMRTLSERFPDILFEGCASGGNRFDLGILRYFPQIWGSDNTDALSRTAIEEGYSYGYPLSSVGSHVAASPNHQTLRSTPLETRYNVAAFGALGYELNVRDMTALQRLSTRSQITLYKAWREVFQTGQFFRGRSGNVHEWTCVTEDKSRAVGMLMRELSVPNRQSERYFASGLDPDRTYRFYNVSGRVNVKLFGSLINTMSPLHIRQDSFMHGIVARMVKIGEEKEDYCVKGSVLMRAGVALAPDFSGTGFNDKVRVFPDFASRMYYMVAVD